MIEVTTVSYGDQVVRHGFDGWQLVKYSWDKTTGMARFTYEKETFGEETRVVEEVQPAYLVSK